MTGVLAVGAGSALGGALRYLVTVALAGWSSRFPIGTLVVNVAGGFLIGLLARAVTEDASAGIRLFLTVGFCGGFTTFSAFSFETLRLMQGDAHGRAAAYAVGSVLLSIGAVWAGLAASRLVTGAE